MLLLRRLPTPVHQLPIRLPDVLSLPNGQGDLTTFLLVVATLAN